MELLRAENIQKVYNTRAGGKPCRALAGVSFSVEAGEFVAIMGASGSGKSTLLNILATLDTPTSGEVFLEGQSMKQIKGKNLAAFRREKLGFVFQDCNLLDTLTAFENIALALTILGTPAGEIDRRVRDTAGLLGLERVLEKYPYQLSGGEQQRVAAARAIITAPALVLADEPTGALDSKSAGQLLGQLSQLNREQGATIVMVTHDAFTASWCHRILFIKDGRLWHELRRDGEDRRRFFQDIIGVVSRLGGDAADVL